MAVAKWLAGLAVVLLALFALEQHQAKSAEEAAWELATSGQIQLTQSTNAKLAAATLERDSLAALVSAAKKLGGTLVAGARITVLKHDTTIVHDSIATTVGVDSSRVGRFRDSTFAGVVSGEVTAPPCCAPLEVTLHVERPEFRPQVGLVQVGQHLAIVVDWQGETTRIDNAYALPLPAKPKRVSPWAEGGYYLVGPSELRAGIALRLFGVEVGPAFRQPLAAQTPQVGLTLHKNW